MNDFIIKDESGDVAKLSVILSFEVKEFNKKYIAYTLNDDGESPSEAVFISELNENNQIVSVPSEDADVVMKCYEALKEEIINS